MVKIIRIIYLSLICWSLQIANFAIAKEKLQIGLLVPLTGVNKDIGKSIIKAVSLAVKDIDNNLIEIFPKDTATRPNQTLRSAYELKQMGIKIIIGPVFSVASIGIVITPDGKAVVFRPSLLGQAPDPPELNISTSDLRLVLSLYSG